MKNTKIKLLLRHLLCLPIIIMFFIPSMLFNMFGTIITYSERPNENQDNAYYLFLKNKNGFFISRRVKGVKKTISYSNLFAQVWLFLRSGKIFTSHVDFSTPIVPLIWKKIPLLNKKKIVYLGHGMNSTKKKSHYNCNSNIDIYTAYGPLEYEMALEMGYHKNNIYKMTMPRLDKYNGKYCNKTLLMLTWDKNLVSKTPKEFMESNYYKKICTLSEPPLVIIRLHPLMQKFSKCFDSEKVSCETIEELMLTTNKLITDRSSIYADYVATDREVTFIDNGLAKQGAWDPRIENNLYDLKKLKSIIFW